VLVASQSCSGVCTGKFCYGHPASVVAGLLTVVRGVISVVHRRTQVPALFRCQQALNLLQTINLATGTARRSYYGHVSCSRKHISRQAGVSDVAPGQRNDGSGSARAAVHTR